MNEVVRIIEEVVKVLRDDRRGVLKEGEFDLRINRLVSEFIDLADSKIKLTQAEQDYVDQVVENLNDEEV